MRIRRYGWDGLQLEVEEPAAWFRTLWDARDRGELDCAEIVPGERTVLLRGVVGTPDLTGWQPSRSEDVSAAPVEIPVCWDGEDLADVARRWGRPPAQVLRELEFTVAFCGFTPGFGYLTGLPEALWLPRLATPRARVPAGSVALAGPYAGIYPRSSPGGWRLAGRTDAVLFDLTADPPALLTPGVRVRFRDA